MQKGLRPNRFCTSQVLELYWATGSPRVEVSMEEALTLKELGTAFLYSLISSRYIKEGRGHTVKNQTLIPSVAHSATKTPPPAAAKPSPYELALVSLTVHPESEFWEMSQLS